MNGDNHPERRALTDARERTIAALAEACARDELSVDEFERRVADAYASSTPPELAALVKDLASPAAETTVTALARRSPDVIDAELVPARRPATKVLAVLSSVAREGPLTFSPDNRVVAVLGSAELDLRDAEFPPGITEIHVRAILGSIDIVVPADLAVECTGIGFLGSFESRVRAVPRASADARRLRIVGSAVLGSVEVHARAPAHVEQVVKELRSARARG